MCQCSLVLSSSWIPEYKFTSQVLIFAFLNSFSVISLHTNKVNCGMQVFSLKKHKYIVDQSAIFFASFNDLGICLIRACTCDIICA